MRTDPVVDLEAEVAALRREVAALRDALACEVRTRRIVVEDGVRDVTIVPGDISVHHQANGCYVIIAAHEDYAMVDVTANDVSPATPGYDHELIRRVDLVAWSERDVEPGGAYAEVTVNGDEIPVPSG